MALLAMQAHPVICLYLVQQRQPDRLENCYTYACTTAFWSYLLRSPQVTKMQDTIGQVSITCSIFSGATNSPFTDDNLF